MLRDDYYSVFNIIKFINLSNDKYEIIIYSLVFTTLKHIIKSTYHVKLLKSFLTMVQCYISVQLISQRINV